MKTSQHFQFTASVVLKNIVNKWWQISKDIIRWCHNKIHCITCMHETPVTETALHMTWRQLNEMYIISTYRFDVLVMNMKITSVTVAAIAIQVLYVIDHAPKILSWYRGNYDGRINDTVRYRQFSLKFLLKYTYSSPVRARYVMYFVDSTSNQYFASVNAVTHAISCYTGPRYDGTRVY